jgi:hypothetical protein
MGHGTRIKAYTLKRKCYQITRHEANETKPRRVSFHFLSGHIIEVEANETEIVMWWGDESEAAEVNILVKPHQEWLRGGKHGNTAQKKSGGSQGNTSGMNDINVNSPLFKP